MHRSFPNGSTLSAATGCRAPEKPIAIAFGFNDWKWGFLAEYFPEYRVAFCQRRLFLRRIWRSIRRNRENIAAFLVWGQTDPRKVRRYAGRHGITLIRIEDGFIRSARLGAAHSTPYSLTVDTKALHFDNQRPSDVETCLNTYAFKSDPYLMQTARELRHLVTDWRIYKYNEPALGSVSGVLPTPREKAVLVIGQVETDRGLILANPGRWSMYELIKLARLENPEARVLYRPHPETFQGFQRSTFRFRRVRKYAEVVSPEVPLDHLLRVVDKVYTISSLSGLEALIRGVRVVTVGTPIYAGWGLTDDRAMVRRRHRMLDIDELFAGIYLLNHRYLADVTDPVLGLKAACLRILADKPLLLASKRLAPADTDKLKALLASRYWGYGLTGAPLAELGVLGGLDLPRIFSSISSQRTRRALVCLLLGQFPTEADRSRFLLRVRPFLSEAMLNSVLMLLHRADPEQYLAGHFAALMMKDGEPGRASGFLSQYLKPPVKEPVEEVEGEDAEPVEDEKERLQAELARLNDFADVLFEEGRYDRSEEVLLYLLVRGENRQSHLMRLAEIASLGFDTVTAAEITRCFLISALGGTVGDRGLSILVDCVRDFGGGSYLADLALYLTAKPESGADVEILLGRTLGRGPSAAWLEVFRHLLYLDGDITAAKVGGWLAAGLPILAVETAERLIRVKGMGSVEAVTYSQALSYCGRLDEAEEVMDLAIRHLPSIRVYKERMRLCVLRGDYETGLALLEACAALQFDVGEMTRRKILFGADRIGEALLQFRDISLKKTVKRAYFAKYADDPVNDGDTGSLLMLSAYGPGDEIRFATTYRWALEHLAGKQVSITCDPRLHSLLARAYPDTTFVPVRRTRRADNYNVADYDRIPSSQLIGLLDNNGVAAIDAADRICLVTDLLADARPDRQSFPRASIFSHQPELAASFARRLPHGRPLVGLSWRSSLTTFARAEHYLSIEDLAPILAMDEIQFVNLQYDDCEEELAWAEAHYPGKLINLPDVDQFNDFESVGALMSCLDLIVAPATTVVELAGAFGFPTWMMGLSSEVHWRNRSGDGRDIWFGSISHLEGDELGSEVRLVAELKRRLHATFSVPTVAIARSG